MQKTAAVMAATLAAATVLAASGVQAQKAPAVQKAQVTVTESGFEPTSLTLKAGVPARVTFTRKTDATCGTEVLLPDYQINKALPLNKPVVVEFTPKKKGTHAFTCGMKMMKGKVVVR